MMHARLTLCLLLLLPLPARAEEAAAPREITFDTLKFEIKKGEAFDRKMLTPEIEKLVGKKVRIAGYIMPGTEAKGIEEFVLFHDGLLNNPWRSPLCEVIVVNMAAGQGVDFTTRKVILDGVFEIRELKKTDNTTFAVYQLTAESASAGNVKISNALAKDKETVQPIPPGAGK